jgi:hypothetical protein
MYMSMGRMKPLPRSLARRLVARSASALLATLLAACNDGGSSTGGGADATAGGEAGATTAPTDFGGVCPDAQLCDDAADCCAGVPPGVTCPGAYPHNWICQTGKCKNAGCTTNAQCAELYTGFVCSITGGIGYCVAPCQDDNDCVVDRNMEGTICQPGGYCREP